MSDPPGFDPDKAMDRPDLDRMLGVFEKELTQAGFKPSAVFSYIDYSGRFVRWLANDYRPRNAPPRPARPFKRSWTVKELRVELDEYRQELVSARLKRSAIQTYVYGGGVFVRWLAGEYRPRKSGRADVSGTLRDAFARADPAGESADAIAARQPSVAVPPDDWFWEGNVQDSVVAWLIARGWHINHMANTAVRARGHDIEATKSRRRLLVEVKGYPSAQYRDPRRSNEVKRTQPSLQAKHWLADALLKAVRLRTTIASAEVAIAFPDFPRYRTLLSEIRAALAKLQISVLLVSEGGHVEGDLDESMAETK